MKKSPREKLLERWTYETYLAHCRAKEEKNGLLSHKQVMQLQILFAERAGKCKHCGSTDNLTADHIFPVVFLKMLGYPAERMFREEWYQCLCRECNHKKKSKVEWEHPATYKILQTAMEEKPTWEYATLQKETAKQRVNDEYRFQKYLGNHPSIEQIRKDLLTNTLS